MTRPDLLTIDDLVVDYGRSDKNAVDGVSLSVREGETLGLVGESGSGKSSIARAALGLTPYRGSIRFQGQELHTATKAQWHTTRGRLQMIFQDPYSTLDPRIRIGVQIAEPFLVHKAAPRTELPVEVASLLERVGLDPAMARRYPHEFSGGQRQRIAIARAIITRPALLVADEAVSALDVSVQAQILNLLMDLQDDLGLGMVFISHDLAVVGAVCDRVLVLQHGKTLESGAAADVLRAPKHPYTKTLLTAAGVRP